MSSRRRSVAFTLRARRDYESILAYGQQEWGKQRAAAYEDAMERVLENLSEFPELGRARDELQPGYRSLGVGQHTILYRANEREIEIVRIVHQKADVKQSLWDEDRSRGVED